MFRATGTFVTHCCSDPVSCTVASQFTLSNAFRMPARSSVCWSRSSAVMPSSNHRRRTKNQEQRTSGQHRCICCCSLFLLLCSAAHSAAVLCSAAPSAAVLCSSRRSHRPQLHHLL